MADRPIIFSAPMVRALLDGRKTQTRRLIKRGGLRRWLDAGLTIDAVNNPANYDLRPYRVGNRLWVREAWRVAAWREDGHIAADYRASPEDVRTPWLHVPDPSWDDLWQQSSDDARKAGEAGIGSTRRDGDGWRWDRGDSPCRWRSAIHMPRWASRLTLHVEAVRVERLQDISEDGASAEGVQFESADPPFYYVPGILPHSLTAVGVEEPGGRHAIRSFAKLWDHLHGDGAWQRNPEVVVIQFRVERCNIDREARAMTDRETLAALVARREAANGE